MLKTVIRSSSIAIISVSILAMTVSSIHAESKAVNGAKTKLNRISDSIYKNETLIKKKKNQKRKVSNSIHKISKDLRYTELRLKKAKNKVITMSNKVKKSQVDVRDARQQFDSTKSQFSKQILSFYKNKNHGIIEYLFMPQKLESFSDSIYYLNKVVDNNINLIGQLKSEYVVLTKNTQKLQRQLQSLALTKTDIKKQKKTLKNKKKRHQRYLVSLQKDIKYIQKRNKQLEKASYALAEFIAKKASKSKVFYGTGRFLKPVKGWISSLFGWRRHPIFKKRIKHRGMDFAAPKGYKIKAADSGIVIVSGMKKQYKGYGKVTVIDHGYDKKRKKRISSVYAHQSRILVKKGDFVKKGQLIGLVGSTGYSTGPHLHFEVRLNGIPVNPKQFLRL